MKESGTLTKHEAVMTKVRGVSLYRERVAFIVLPEDDEEEVSHLLNLPRDLWEEMGQPETITMTVEPGDKLNG